MKIAFRCSCGARFEVDSTQAGRRIRCKACARESRIPEAAAPEPDVREADDTPAAAAPLPPRREAAPTEPERPAASRRPGRRKDSLGVSDPWNEVNRRKFIGLILFALTFGAWTFLRRPRTRSSGWPATLAEARRGFQTRPVSRGIPREPVEPPPPGVFELVRYPSPVGPLPAYLTPDPGEGRKRPAIVWITGGDCNSIGDVWSPAPASNDQTARAFREAGIVLMFPSLRGGNDNPGTKEGFLGEVDDVLAAAEYLARQPYVDPARIYLGGHSTGGTLVLLVAESSDRFRAVFSFGPVDDVGGYGPEFLPFNTGDRREVEIRSPLYWLESVRSPTFVLEGDRRGNAAALASLRTAARNPQLRFHVVRGADHFSILEPATRALAARILEDPGPPAAFRLDQADLDALSGR